MVKKRTVPELDRLVDGLAELAQAGHIAPCVGRPEWTSDDPDDRADAAEGCAWCPMAGPCLAAGAASRSVWGVWGGLDLSDPATRRAVQEAEL